VNTRISFSSRLPARLRWLIRTNLEQHRLAKAVPVLEAESGVLGQGLKKELTAQIWAGKPLCGAPRRSFMTDILPNIVEVNDRIDVARENLRALVEQAAAYSGAADEDLISQRIAEHEALLERLIKQRDELSQKAGT
jgi:hypothetical protein